MARKHQHPYTTGELNPNELLVLHMMNFSRAGALKQAFVIEAIQRYSHMVLKDTTDWSGSIVSKESWQQCARECIESIETRRIA